MSHTLLITFSIFITALIYLTFIGAFKLGGWMVRNQNISWVKILEKVMYFTFHGFILFLIWGLVIQVLTQVIK